MAWMTSARRAKLERLAPYGRHALGVVVLLGTLPAGLLRGPPAVALWLAFWALGLAVLLFWESLRTALDPAAPGDDPEETDGAPLELEARKRAALRALKDIAFERSIGRLGEDDYKNLEARYRAEARAAMQAADEGLGPWLARAEALLDGEGPAATAAPAAPPPRAPQKGPCAGCGTPNDADAVFCKKCGRRVAEEAAP
ncbi:MAG: zinc ribbon domain-containing protein [Deltaproteobacteria bacterium]|nr:zinc ribbon domain-containing protein [Deltaproteobacteria bacterium]